MPERPLLADPEAGTIDDLIDIDRYPLDSPDRSRALAHAVGAELRSTGLAVIPGFLRPAALDRAARDVAAVVPHVPIRHQRATVYHRAVIDDPEDPCATELTWFAGHITRDMIPPYWAAHRLYVSADFKRFVAACVGRERVYEYADPLAGLVVTVLPPGGRYPWHYDTNEFVLTLMVGRPDGGGRFEYCKDLRSPGDENLAGLGRVLRGEAAADIRSVETEPGDLQLFLGRYSLHQVTETVGTRDRLVLVFSYADRPGVIGPADRTRSVYGRVTEAHLLAEQVVTATSDGLIL